MKVYKGYIVYIVYIKKGDKGEGEGVVCEKSIRRMYKNENVQTSI